MGAAVLAGLDVAKTEFYVSETLFGGNFLADRDRVGPGTFDEKIAALNISSLRYPGGSITEEFFSLADPNRDSVIREDGKTQTWMPLDDFLAYSTSVDMPVTIVIPTRNALGPGPVGSRDIRVEAVAELQIFTRDLLTGKYGPADIFAFEIGNEYWGSGQMTSVEYGKVASAFSLALRQVIDSLGQVFSGFHIPQVVVQIGQNGKFDTSETSFQLNKTVMAEFSPEEAAAVDAVVAHYYTSVGVEGFVRNDSRFNRLEAWENSTFGSLKKFITEWNIESPGSSEQGLKQAGALVGMFSEFVFRGIDAAWVWPIQQNNINSLAGNEGTSALTIGGEAYKLMSDVLVGAYGLGRVINEQFGLYSFVKGDQLVVFVASHTDAPQAQSLDLAAWSENVLGIDGVLLSTPDDRNSHLARPTLSELGFTLQGGKISFALGPHEVARLEISISDASRLMPVGLRNGTEAADSMEGSDLREEFFGRSGNDSIMAGGGNDTVFGGRGSDTVDLGAGNDLFGQEPLQFDLSEDRVTGGDGNDLIIGGIGDDWVSGGRGADVLIGGTGNDTIIGGAQADTLHGNAGIDYLEGGGGNDLLIGGLGADIFVFNERFGDDVIRDFSSEDRIDLRGIEIDHNSLEASLKEAEVEHATLAVHINALGTIRFENVASGSASLDWFLTN